MPQDPRYAGRPPHEDEVTVHLTRGAGHGAPADDGVTVLVPGAMLAPAPTPQVAPGEAPVFVDDSGGRKRLLRLAGVLIALLSIGFIGIVGVALAVPNVATSVGLGNVIPFMVPGAAALPPSKAPPTSQVQVAAPTPKPKPVVIVAATTEPEPVDVEPTTDPVAETTAPATTAPATVAPTEVATATVAPATPDPGGIGTGGTPVQGGAVPVDVTAVDANVPAAVNQAPQN
jgi:hypothetical protein